MNDEGLEKRRQDLAVIRKALDEIKDRTQGISMLQQFLNYLYVARLKSRFERYN